jgi:glucose-specific phosphotransferase system IIA component
MPKVLGEGLAIDPYETVMRAPCADVILTIHPAHHALTLKADSGAEILMHIGLDTVTLKGEGFKVMAADGQRVAPGDPLIAFDLDVLSARVPSLMIPLLVSNGDDFEIVSRASEGSVAAGAEILRVRSPRRPDLACLDPRRRARHTRADRGRPEAARIPSGAPMLVDADKGAVTVWPKEALLSATRSAMATRKRRASSASSPTASASRCSPISARSPTSSRHSPAARRAPGSCAASSCS